jgi:8-oxo-dGTP pyrophosphatase MutT (NUDIX family)
VTDSPNTVEIKPAATVVVIRDSDQGVQVLMLRRNTAVKFAGGAWVFPGGRVDDEDHVGATDTEQALRQAAIRECEEEAGLQLVANQLQRFANWITPANMHKRFDTAFFVAVLEGDPQVIIDGSEIHEYQWMLPQEAMAAHIRGDMKLMPPTYITLLELAELATAGELLAAYRDRGTRYFEPRVCEHGDKLCFLYAGDAGYDDENPDQEGARHRTLMGKNGLEYQSTIGFFAPL